MEKLVADGTILRYEIDTESVQKSSPELFYVFYIAPDAKSLEKGREAQRDAVRSTSASRIQVFDSMVGASGTG